jgi:hypothetical protein
LRRDDNITYVTNELKQLASNDNVKIIYSIKDQLDGNNNVCIALTKNGKVISWKNIFRPGNCTRVRYTYYEHNNIPDSDLSDFHISKIYSVYGSCAALTHNGQVITWAYLDDLIHLSINNQTEKIKTICTSNAGYAGLTQEGKVALWGDHHSYNNALTTIKTTLDQNTIKKIFSTQSAFAALTDAGRVIIWGKTNAGGRVITIHV